MNSQIVQVYFSPSGSTKRISEYMAGELGKDIQTFDLMKEAINKDVSISKDKILLVSLPVFAGRIPAICAEFLTYLKGNNTPAIIAAVYGNRDYDDALVEIYDILDRQGFSIVGAAAFVARHTIFSVAQERPDEKDFGDILDFIKKCISKLENGIVQKDLKIKGNRPYKESGGGSLKPTGNDKCTNCGACSAVCPVNAINSDRPKETDISKCISCTACIYVCPENARGFHNEMFKMANADFVLNYSERRKSEIFI